jgi:hypothetical protein
METFTYGSASAWGCDSPGRLTLPALLSHIPDRSAVLPESCLRRFKRPAKTIGQVITGIDKASGQNPMQPVCRSSIALPA